MKASRPGQVSAFYLKSASHFKGLFGKRKRGSVAQVHTHGSGSHAFIISPTLRLLQSFLTLPHLHRLTALRQSSPTTLLCSHRHLACPTPCLLPSPLVTRCSGGHIHVCTFMSIHL